MPVIDAKKLLDNRVEAIRKYHADTGIKRAELDVSGGIDSAVMAGLLVMALGEENCTFAHLRINSDPKQTHRDIRLINGIGAKLAVLDVTEEYRQIVNKTQASLLACGYDIFEIEKRLAADPTILGSIRSTLRAPLGRAFNRITGGGIRHGTGNECEDRFLRFYQKGGDGEVDTNPIAMLSKAEIYQLAFELANHFGETAKQAYYDTIGTIPSADLWGVGDKHNDESEIANWLGASFTYGRLDVTTGKVINVGTIERVARFLDEANVGGVDAGGRDRPLQSDVTFATGSHRKWQEMWLFRDTLSDADLAYLVDRALGSAAFGRTSGGGRVATGLDESTIAALLKGARKAERQTRHKLNPAIPQLGTRQELLDAGILSDNFADYGI